MVDLVAVVDYDYTAKEPDELTIRKGDIIRNVVIKSIGWSEGTLRDKRGMFPDNFVTVKNEDQLVQLRAKSNSKNEIRQCRAIFSYHPTHDDELSLAIGDIVDIIAEVEVGWWKGKLADKEGVFPSNFVTELDSTNSKEDLLTDNVDTNCPTLPPKPTKTMCLVNFPYEACNDDELTIKQGNIITLISKEGQDVGWWRGELNGHVGVFPDNFVTVLPTHKLELKQQPPPPESTHVASKRKPLELKVNDGEQSVTVPPPIPGKKPSVPKKSPVTGARQKVTTETVDGVAPSRLQMTESNDFDHVERSAMLADMRATRAKAPGRRPPSVLYRETEATNLVNGNSEADTSNEEELLVENSTDQKSKLGKHRAPWMEELKLNQAAKRGPSPSANMKSVPETNIESEQQELSPVDLYKLMTSSSSGGGGKTPPNAAVKTFLKFSPTDPPMETKPERESTSPITNKYKMSPSTTTARPHTFSSAVIGEKKSNSVPLEERVVLLETKMQQMQTLIDELQQKLQIEMDLRRLLQTELEKVAQCVTQV